MRQVPMKRHVKGVKKRKGPALRRPSK